MFSPRNESPTFDQDTTYDTVSALERDNARLNRESSYNTILLKTLTALLQIETQEESFRLVTDALHQIFEFDLCAAFLENAPDHLICIAATEEALIRKSWKTRPFLQRVLHGNVAACAHSQDIPEAEDAPAGLMKPEASALFLPLTIASRQGLLVLEKTPDAKRFDTSDLTLAHKFRDLISDILEAVLTRPHNRSHEISARTDSSSTKTESGFIANMSHELRTPLNAIIGFSEFISSEMLGPIGSAKYSEYIHDINASGNQLLALVDNILLYSKIEAGQHKVEITPVSLSESVQKACHALTMEARKRHVPVIVEALPDTLKVLSDSRSLHQILINLIDNAIKFSLSGQPVLISEETRPDTCTLKIVDHGPGIPEDILNQIGTPFLQSESVLARSHHGTGIGLAISSRLAKSVHARIWLDSSKGTGTTAYLELPVSASNHSAEQAVEQRA